MDTTSSDSFAPGKAFYIIDEDHLRQFIIDAIPLIPTDWLAQYEFFHKIITDQVERLRFNDGLEPLDVDLYAVVKKHRSEPDYLGVTRIGTRAFHALARYCLDQQGKKILRVQIRPAS